MRRTWTIAAAALVCAATLATLGATRRDNTTDAADQATPSPHLTPVTADAYPAAGALIVIWDHTERAIYARPGQTVLVDRPMWASVLARAADQPEDATAMCAIRVGGRLVAADAIHMASAAVSCEWPSPWVR